ncbi:MAG: hypothetical protein K2L99_03450 [Muribaculaceae bacterium]|nr:hypothetical protein [Muribaculaceae bacterium]
MKLFKYSVLALALAAGFASCSDEETYVAGAASDGVYFPTTDSVDVELDRKVPTFDIVVSRLGETQAATYGLVCSADDEVFTMPTSVSFAQGESSVTLKIPYEAANMGMDKPYKVKMAFAEGTKISSYGYESLELSVVLPAPWITVGKGTFNDLWVLPCYYELEGQITWEVELQRHELDETRYRFLNPYGEAFAKACSADGLELDESQYDAAGKYNIEFFVDEDGNMLLPYQATGATISEDEGMLWICNEAGRYYSLSGYDFETILYNLPDAFNKLTWGVKTDAAGKPELDENGKEIIEVKTIFQGPGLLRINFEPNPDGLYQLNSDPGGYNWWAEGVEIKDYKADIEYQGVLSQPNETQRVLVDFKLGADVARAVAGLVKTTNLEAAVDAVLNGEVATQEIKVEPESTQDTYSLRFAFDGSADYTVAVIVYNADGDQVGTNAVTFFVADNSKPSEWQSLGMGTYTDMFALPLFGIRDGSWSVEVQQNTEDPRFYRWVHPYGSAYAEWGLENEIFGAGVAVPAAQYDSANELYMNFVVVGNRVAVPVQNTAVILSGQYGAQSGGNIGGFNIESDDEYSEDGFDAIENYFATNDPNVNAFCIATFSNGKLVMVTQPENATIVSWANAGGKFYQLKDDVGGVNWVADGYTKAGAPAKVAKAGKISLYKAMNGAGMVKSHIRHKRFHKSK